MRYQVIVSVPLILSVCCASQSTPVQEPRATCWVGTVSDGSTFVFELHASGRLRFTPTTGVISKGTWKLRGNAIEIELNKKFVRLTGAVEFDRMRGIASTRRGEKWKWSATKQPYVVATAAPEYPPLARAARISGSGIIDVEVDSLGAVRSVRLVSGHPLLRAASEQAAHKFRFEPDVQVVSRTARLTFVFRLMDIDDEKLGIPKSLTLSPYEVEVRRGRNILY